MAGKIPDLHATVRAGTGKGAARQARRDGLVPGVVYGGGQDSQAINIPFNILFKMLKSGGFMSTLFNLKMDGEEDVRCICRGVQRDVVKDLPTHVDLLRLKRDSRVNMNITVEVLGEEESVGLKKGGSLNLVRPEVELMVTAGNIPDCIQIDISDVDLGENVTISQVELPEGSRPIITDRDFVIASIAAPKTASEEDESEDGTEEGAEEGSEEATEDSAGEGETPSEG